MISEKRMDETFTKENLDKLTREQLYEVGANFVARLRSDKHVIDLVEIDEWAKYQLQLAGDILKDMSGLDKNHPSQIPFKVYLDAIHKATDPILTKIGVFGDKIKHDQTQDIATFIEQNLSSLQRGE
jgi:hypothetical protein